MHIFGVTAYFLFLVNRCSRTTWNDFAYHSLENVFSCWRLVKILIKITTKARICQDLSERTLVIAISAAIGESEHELGAW